MSISDGQANFNWGSQLATVRNHKIVLNDVSGTPNRLTAKAQLKKTDVLADGDDVILVGYGIGGDWIAKDVRMVDQWTEEGYAGRTTQLRLERPE